MLCKNGGAEGLPRFMGGPSATAALDPRQICTSLYSVSINIESACAPNFLLPKQQSRERGPRWSYVLC